MGNITKDNYEATIELNALVVRYIVTWLETKSNKAIARMFELLKPVTLQEVYSVIKKLSLQPTNYVEDMFQDTFFKLVEALDNYDPNRNPVFITFWRRCAKNFLLSKYYSSQNPVELVTDPQDKKQQDPLDTLLIAELLDHYRAEFVANSPTVKIKTFDLVRAILTQRIFALPSVQVKQECLAKTFSVTQGYISRWECWLKDKIRADFPEFSCKGESDARLAR